MEDHSRLLEEAAGYCNLETGEVVSRMPSELMTALRAAKLARGVVGRRNERTESTATWFVFFSDGIRNDVLTKVRARAAVRKQRRSESRQNAEAGPDVPPIAPVEVPCHRGLRAFRQRKNSAD
jgi:hypothetical protein